MVEKDSKAVKLKVEEKTKPAPAKKLIKAEQPKAPVLQLFSRWDTNITVQDPGLKQYITLTAILSPYSSGRNYGKRFWKSKTPIVERLINRVMVSGHSGKKHRRTSRTFTGKKANATKVVLKALQIIENKVKSNPVEVFVRAIEQGAPREGITSIEYGGVRYPKAVDLSPQRRIDLALRWFTQGSFSVASSSKGKKPLAEALAEQIILTQQNDNKAICISRKIDLERQAQSSR